jgi:hypothetical protein
MNKQTGSPPLGVLTAAKLLGACRGNRAQPNLTNSIAPKSTSFGILNANKLDHLEIAELPGGFGVSGVGTGLHLLREFDPSRQVC